MATAVGSYATSAALKTLANINDSSDDTLLGLICDRVNQFIEDTCRTVISPITSAAYTYDGNGLTRLFLPFPPAAATHGIGGARAVSLVEFAPYTAATYETIASTDYFLRELVTNGGPYRWLVLSDLPAGSYSVFPKGRATVRVTMTAGWAAIPDDVTEMALNIALRAWNARQSGQQTLVGADEIGQRGVGQYVDGRDRQIMKKYTARMPY